MASAILRAVVTALLVALLFADTTSAFERQAVNRKLQQDNPNAKLDGEAAKKFCSSPQFSKLTCDWVSRAEESESIKHQCPFCGTLYRRPPKSLPTEEEGHHTYNQYITKIISLACKGQVVVRSVFKMVAEPPIKKQKGWAGNNCTNSALVPIDDDGTTSPVVRCDLQLSSEGGTEVEHAMKGKEGKCWQCARCSRGEGCPSKVGMWYVDVFTTTLKGCDIGPQGYMPTRVGININPDTKILLAKWEVCNSASCFNKDYEQAKIKAARPCKNAKCPA